MRQGVGVLFLSLKMSQNSIDDVLVFNAGDDFYRTAAPTANLYIVTEYALEPLSPGHCCMLFGGRANLRTFNWLHTFTAFCRCNQPAAAMIRSENAMVTREVDPRLRHQGR